MSVKSLVVAVLSLLTITVCLCHNDNGGNPVQQTGDKKVYGIFELFIDPVERKTTLLGTLLNGQKPLVGWDTVMRSGECSLIVPGKPECTDCLGGFTCVADNDCKPEPDKISSVGKVTITGLKTKDSATTFSMDPINGNYQPINNQVRLAYPSCIENGTITLAASGTDTFAGFTLTGKGINPLAGLPDSLPMEPGKSIDLNWTPPTIPGSSKILVSIDLSYHGGTAAKVESSGPDDGQLTIPAVLLDSLSKYPVNGHPKIEVSRIAISSDPSTGVQLRMISMVKVWLKIPGVMSCSDISQCPSGEDCVFQRCRKVSK